MDVVLRLLFSAAVFIRFGERVWSVMLASCSCARRAQPHLMRAVAPLLTPHDLPPHVKCSASTPVCEGAKQYRTPTSEGACGGAELEVSSSENVPKDLRFSIGPDIKDALPGFS